MSNNGNSKSSNFIRHIVTNEIESNKIQQGIITRFPPEPNGFLHIGHAKSMCLNFGLPLEFSGYCNLRFDDTNPDKEEEEYAEAIKADVKWLGFDFKGHLHYASDYFEQIYKFACELIEHDKAYVDDQSIEQIRLTRGTLTTAGTESPHRNRSVKENLSLFQGMYDGKFEEGSHVLRAKIDMASPNINLRDPALYRIKRTTHHRTGDQWHIYPLYDFTHCISDAIEGVTHSLCTLEFEDHRPLYDWVLNNISIDCHPQQIEFARLELNYTVTSKRKLHQLVTEGYVNGWGDPRLPTLKGMRKRGYPAEAIKDFCDRIGITKKQAVIDTAVLENCVRENLDTNAARAMVVLDPIKVILTNFPAEETEWIEVPNHPKNDAFGKRKIPLTREIYIERNDFMENPPKKFHRLSEQSEVRLRYGYAITCEDVVKDNNGNLIELHCKYDSQSGGGKTSDGRKIRGIIHWVSATLGQPMEVNLIDRLFNSEDPASADNFLEHINSNSLIKCDKAVGEPSLGKAKEGDTFQFERLGYFCRDEQTNAKNTVVFNRTVTLRDTWAKITQS
ncbi:MAG: glutamine--tRNA ligase/YqeY domain fusion protein [Gammaproteobacteria bacterium]